MARQQYTRYETATGKIIGWFGCRPAIADAQLLTGQGRIDDSYRSDDFYIQNGVAVARPDNNTTINTTSIQGDGIDEATISNIPNPSEVRVFGVGDYTVTDGEFVFTVDTPGEYRIIVDSFPIKEKEFIINAS